MPRHLRPPPQWPLLAQVWFWATVNRVTELFNGGRPTFWITILHNVFSSIQGFLNCLVYGLTPVVRDRLMETKAGRWLCCCCEKQDGNRKGATLAEEMRELELQPYDATADAITDTLMETELEERRVAREMRVRSIMAQTEIDEGRDKVGYEGRSYSDNTLRSTTSSLHDNSDTASDVEKDGEEEDHESAPTIDEGDAKEEEVMNPLQVASPEQPEEETTHVSVVNPIRKSIYLSDVTALRSLGSLQH